MILFIIEIVFLKLIFISWNDNFIFVHIFWFMNVFSISISKLCPFFLGILNFREYKSYFPGEIWKPLRKMLTGIFSTGKLKAMLPPLMTVSNKNLDYLEKEVAKNPVLNVKPIVQGIFFFRYLLFLQCTLYIYQNVVFLF